MLAYLIAVYPFAVQLAARLSRRQGDDGEPCELPAVTLIIPARDEAAILEAKLANVLELDYPGDRLQILVANDASSDATAEIAERFSERGVQLMNSPEWRGKTSTINEAVKQATGDVLCCCDANVFFERDVLKRLIQRLEEKRVGAVSGDVRLRSHESNFSGGESLYYRLERWLQRGESRIGSMTGVDGGMYVIRKELFKPLPPDTILDDFVISMQVIKQGYRIVYEPSAVATENGTPRARDEFRRRVRVAAGAMQSIKRRQWPPLRRPVELWQYLSHKLLRWLGPVWLVLLLGSNAMLWNAGLFYQCTLVAQLGFYTLGGLATVWVAFRRTRLGGIPFYFTMSHVAMAIGLFKGLFWRQKGTWKRTERSTASAGNQQLELTSKAS